MKAAYIPALSTREWLGTKLSAQHAGISSGHCKTHLSVGKVTLTPLSCLPSGLRIRGAFTRLPCPVRGYRGAGALPGATCEGGRLHVGLPDRVGWQLPA